MIQINNQLYKNVLFLGIVKGAEYIFPLITLPYLVRILGSNKYGLMMFTVSFASFFVILTNYGFDLSATRKASLVKNNKKEISKLYSTVLLIKISLLLVSILVYFSIVISFVKFNVYINLYAISFISVIGNVIYPIWLFQGIEKMKYITFLSLFGRIITVVLTFLFVKSPSDVKLANLFYNLPYFIAGLASIYIIHFKLKIRLTRVSIGKIKQELVDGWHIFTTSFMTNILSSSGTFILGLFQSSQIVGIYAAIEKLVKSITGVFSPVFQALFPYFSNKFSLDKEKATSMLIKLGKFIILFSLIICIAVLMFSNRILVLMYGIDFEKYAKYLNLFTIWIISSIFNNLIGIQYLVASGKSKIYSKSFFISTLVTLLLFFLLAPSISIWGSILSVIIGEVTLSISMLLSIQSKDKFIKLVWWGK
ncbi:MULTISPECIES: flippase [Heyndrickxia]|uniref:flippase n=1 Tax=Heyndrickxia TaxID=2837504 RepID=UPI0003674004|nr:flippase [Heyndrickxia coagulans]